MCGSREQLEEQNKRIYVNYMTFESSNNHTYSGFYVGCFLAAKPASSSSPSSASSAEARVKTKSTQKVNLMNLLFLL